MKRLSMAGWMLAAGLTVGLLPGCTEVVAQQAGGNPTESEGTKPSPTRRVSERTDWRAYYAYSRGVWAEIQGDLDAAVMWSREALRYDPTSLTLRLNVTSALLKKGDFRGAIREGDEILAQDSDNVQAHLLLAASYQGLRNVRGAEKHYREVIRLDPKRSEAYLFLGNLYTETRNYPEAIQVFESLIKVSPRNHLAYFSLGRVLMELKEPE